MDERKEEAAGAKTFLASGDRYDAFMGRYSRPLGNIFADAAGVADSGRALDVGCGPGALTGALVERLGAGSVSAIDPSPPFVEACAARYPGVETRTARAEELPFDDSTFDYVLAQLVLHFVSEPGQAADEFRRVLRPGGTAAACVWDFAQGMQMLRLFWDAALELDPVAPDEATTLRFGREGEITALLQGAGFEDVVENTLDVESTYADFDELWSGFQAGIGPSGAYCVGLTHELQSALREELFGRLGSPSGSFTLAATARCATGRAPG